MWISTLGLMRRWMTTYSVRLLHCLTDNKWYLDHSSKFGWDLSNTFCLLFRKRNYITPKTYKTILSAITQHAMQLDLYIEEQVDLNILTWLECFKDIVGVHNYNKLHIELKGVFLLDLNNKALNIEIKYHIHVSHRDTLQFSEVGL